LRLSLLIGAASLSLVGVVLSAGCEGHGKYTSAFKAEAEANAAAIHSATEWDAANQAYHSGNIDRALQHIELSISLKGDVSRSHLLHAKILLEDGDSDRAFGALGTGLALDAGSHELHYYRGILHERMGDFRLATTDYEAAMALEPSQLQYVIAASETLVSLGDLDGAEALLKRSNDRFGHAAGLKQALGHIALMRDDLTAASSYFSQAKVLDPKSATIDEDLARVLIEQERFIEARYTLSQLLSRPTHSERRDLRLMHARTLIETDEPVLARDLLMDITRENAGAAEITAWRLLIDVALMLEDDYLLERASDRLIASTPREPDGYLARAMWQRRQGKFEDAMASADLASRHASDDDRVRVMREIIAHDLALAGR